MTISFAVFRGAATGQKALLVMVNGVCKPASAFSNHNDFENVTRTDLCQG